MSSPHIDLSYLERFCQGNRDRMVKYITLYLAEAPALFAELEEVATALEADGIAATAHSLRPLMHQMGAMPLMHLLTSIEERAPLQGAAAAAPLVQEALTMSAAVNGELRNALAHLSAA